MCSYPRLLLKFLIFLRIYSLEVPCYCWLENFIIHFFYPQLRLLTSEFSNHVQLIDYEVDVIEPFKFKDKMTQ